MQDEFFITNGINHHHCESLEEAYELGQFYATELQGEIRIFINSEFHDKIAPQPKNESI